MLLLHSLIEYEDTWLTDSNLFFLPNKVCCSPMVSLVVVKRIQWLVLRVRADCFHVHSTWSLTVSVPTRPRDMWACLSIFHLFNCLGNVESFNHGEMLLSFCYQVFKPDDKNGMEVQNQVDALLDRQKRESQTTVPKTPNSRLYPVIESKFF